MLQSRILCVFLSLNMIDSIIIVLLWAICIIVAFVILPVWRRHFNAGKGLSGINRENNKQLISEALKSLNCAYNWGEDHDDLLVKYDYQSGHFRIRLEKESPYVRLCYLFFFDTSLENLEQVRQLCNQCNINTETLRIVYSINDQKNMVDVHLVTGLLLNEKTAEDVLTRAMTDMFRWQNAFNRRFNEIADNAKSESKDQEQDNAHWRRELFLLREQEIMHQATGPDWRQDVDNKITLRQMLATTMDIRDLSPLHMSVGTSGSVSQVAADDILDYDLSSPIIANGSFVEDSAILSLTYFDAKHPDAERRLLMNICSEKVADEALYYRVTITSIPLSVQPQVTFGSSENRPDSRSVLVAYDLTSPKQRLDEFRYMWKEALDKEKKGETDTLTDEQRLISDCMNPQLGNNLYRGKVLFEQKRFYEALLHLENAFVVMQSAFKDMKISVKEKFFEVSYLIGFCYCELKRYRLAYYYLEMTLPLHRITYTEEYINALVNGGDFRAINIIDGLLTDMETAQEFGDDDEQPQDFVLAFVSFLKRRKAYVFIDQQRYDEAEKLLKKMLDDPDNSDFALNELAYIQKMRGEN